ncbi:MAG: WYL domain-containing protein [Proteobacteria bacterium]|nr:WYL domain-containing protein [Pseudomonadota bacterium]
MPRHAQVVRQWKLLRRLERAAQGQSVAELAGDEVAAQRACYRDLEALQAAGFPLYTEEREGLRRWCLTEAFRSQRAIPLATSELLALRAARSALRHFAQTPFFEGLQALSDKLDALLAPEQRRFAEQMDDIVVGDRFGSPDHGALRELIDTLTEACARRVTLAITYRASRGDETTRRVDPYKLWLHRGSAYLVAHCHLRQAVRTFAVARIAAALPTDATFDRPTSFDFDRFVHDRFRICGDGQPTPVTLWFAPEVARYIRERTWHPTQQLTPAADGAVTLTMTVDGLTELAAWLLSFGPRARVLAPTTLATHLQTQLHAALAGYEGREQADANASASKKQ